jgi:hypothetical protein
MSRVSILTKNAFVGLAFAFLGVAPLLVIVLSLAPDATDYVLNGFNEGGRTGALQRGHVPVAHRYVCRKGGSHPETNSERNNECLGRARGAPLLSPVREVLTNSAKT